MTALDPAGPTIPTWRLYARDVANARQAPVLAFTRLEAILRFNAPGSWLLDLPYDAELDHLFDFRGGLIVTRDGVTVFSGPVRHRERTVELGRRDELRVGGTDDTGLLGQSLVWPDPAGPPYVAPYDLRSGPAENVMRAYVRVTVGEQAVGYRRINGLNSGTDGGLGRTVQAQPRFENLLDVLQDLARRGGDDPDHPLFFRVLQDTANPTVLNFLVSVPVDRSRSAVFSLGRKTLLGYVAREQVAGPNAIVALGKGELEQQALADMANPTAIWRYGRVEGAIRATHLDDLQALRDAAQAEADKAQPRLAVELTPAETASLQPLRDYHLGDRVTVILDGPSGPSARAGIVRELAITIDARAGARVRPLVALEEALL